VAQIVESKVSNLRSLEQFMETLIRTLTPTGCAWLGRQDAIHSHDSRVQTNVAEAMERAARGIRKAHSLAESIGDRHSSCLSGLQIARSGWMTYREDRQTSARYRN
jgi:hypothetical protein